MPFLAAFPLLRDEKPRQGPARSRALLEVIATAS